MSTSINYDLDVLEVVTGDQSEQVAGNPDVFEVGHNGTKLVTSGETHGIALVQKQELHIAQNNPTVLQVFENGVFGGGGGGGAATDGATAAVIESDGFAYVGREVADDADAVTSTWQIYRVPSSSLGDTPSYADGNKNYDNDWTNRTNLSYSTV